MGGFKRSTSSTISNSWFISKIPGASHQCNLDCEAQLRQIPRSSLHEGFPQVEGLIAYNSSETPASGYSSRFTSYNASHFHLHHCRYHFAGCSWIWSPDGSAIISIPPATNFSNPRQKSVAASFYCKPGCCFTSCALFNSKCFRYALKINLYWFRGFDFHIAL